jgi:putative ABC transport system substrate-binding protein
MNRRKLITVLVGSAISWPLAAVVRAQQKAMPVIGFLNTGAAGPAEEQLLSSFRQGLGETGFVEGQKVAIEYRRAEGNYARLPALAADLVDRRVDVIVAPGPPAAFAAKRASSTIPIIFSMGDPVEGGFVASLARPGGNLTGVSLLIAELMPKRLELLSEMVPQAGVIALLVGRNIGKTERIMQDAARAKGVQLTIVEANTEKEIEAAVGSIPELHAGALVIADNPFFNTRRSQLAALSVRYALPAISAYREFAASGGLMSYGASSTAAFRQLGIYVGKVLNGAKPADLPVEQPTKFELVINRKAAKKLGLTMPPSILARADEVIE